MNPETTHTNTTPKTQRRGFASMSPEKRRLIASVGGKTAHSMGRAHVFTSEEAQAAGRKGGLAVSQDLEHMSRIGKVGGSRRPARVSADSPQLENPAPAPCEAG